MSANVDFTVTLVSTPLRLLDDFPSHITVSQNMCVFVFKSPCLLR